MGFKPEGAKSGQIDRLYRVDVVKSSIGKEFIRKHHYSHGCHNGPMTWGLYKKQRLIGVIAFATPCSENVRRSIFGPAKVDSVTELHRLVILDGTPTNTESWFISRALKLLKERKPGIQAVISFADATEGHSGIIYMATNAFFTGTTGRATFYKDEGGRLRHPRQNGVNISLSEAENRHWVPVKRDAKNRYVYILGNGPAETRRLKKEMLLEPLPYPDH